MNDREQVLKNHPEAFASYEVDRGWKIFKDRRTYTALSTSFEDQEEAWKDAAVAIREREQRT